eukprot:8926306-Prorocentrum_lima.AAC.1
MAELHPRLRVELDVAHPPHLIRERELAHVRPLLPGVWVAVQHRHDSRPRHTVCHQALGALQRC